MAGIGIRIRFIWVIYLGVVASREQWKFGIFAVGLQMAIKFNQVKSSPLVESLTSPFEYHFQLTSILIRIGLHDLWHQSKWWMSDSKIERQDGDFFVVFTVHRA